MFGHTSVLFGTIFAIVVCFEIDFYSVDHLRCDVSEEIKDYAEVFCMARPQNLRAENPEAYLKHYGRWQFFVIIQIFISAIICRIECKIRSLSKEIRNTIVKRYILTTLILLLVIACWTLTNLSLGGLFNTYIFKLFYHAIDTRLTISPIVQMFPPTAICNIEYLVSDETTMATCDLPLNKTTPYYFLILWLAYFLSLLCTLNCLLGMAWNEIQKTYDLRRQLQSLEEGSLHNEYSQVNLDTNDEEKNDKKHIRLIAFHQRLSDFIKRLTKPQVMKSSQLNLI